MEGEVNDPNPAIPRSQGNWIQSALADIGVATIVTDARGHVLFMYPVAESLTGWRKAKLPGRPSRPSSGSRTSQPADRSRTLSPRFSPPGSAVGLANHIVLIARDGTEWGLDDGAAPFRDAAGERRSGPS